MLLPHSPPCVICRSIHIVALGSECPGGVGPGDEIMGQGQLQGGLLWSYLGHGAMVGPCDLESSLHNPAFMEYTSRVFGDVTVVVQDCPSWVRNGCVWGERLARVMSEKLSWLWFFFFSQSFMNEQIIFEGHLRFFCGCFSLHCLDLSLGLGCQIISDRKIWAGQCFGKTYQKNVSLCCVSTSVTSLMSWLCLTLILSLRIHTGFQIPRPIAFQHWLQADRNISILRRTTFQYAAHSKSMKELLFLMAYEIKNCFILQQQQGMRPIIRLSEVLLGKVCQSNSMFLCSHFIQIAASFLPNDLRKVGFGQPASHTVDAWELKPNRGCLGLRLEVWVGWGPQLASLCGVFLMRLFSSDLFTVFISCPCLASPGFVGQWLGQRTESSWASGHPGH